MRNPLLNKGEGINTDPTIASVEVRRFGLQATCYLDLALYLARSFEIKILFFMDTA